MAKRKTKSIKVKDIEGTEYEVEIKKNLSWGEKQDIQEEFTKGAEFNASGLGNFDSSVIRKAQYKSMEVCIDSIKNGEDEVEFSKDWADNLTIEDGDKLYDEIDNIVNLQKKGA